MGILDGIAENFECTEKKTTILFSVGVKDLPAS